MSFLKSLIIKKADIFFEVPRDSTEKLFKISKYKNREDFIRNTLKKLKIPGYKLFIVPKDKKQMNAIINNLNFVIACYEIGYGKWIEDYHLDPISEFTKIRLNSKKFERILENSLKKLIEEQISYLEINGSDLPDSISLWQKYFNPPPTVDLDPISKREYLKNKQYLNKILEPKKQDVSGNIISYKEKVRLIAKILKTSRMEAKDFINTNKEYIITNMIMNYLQSPEGSSESVNTSSSSGSNIQYSYPYPYPYGMAPAPPPIIQPLADFKKINKKLDQLTKEVHVLHEMEVNQQSKPKLKLEKKDTGFFTEDFK